MSVVYFNHQIVNRKETNLSSSFFSFGDGAFTTLKLLDGRLFFLRQHLKRIARNASFLGLSVPEIPMEAFYELAKRADAFEGLWRFKILITSKDSEIDLSKQRQSNLVITLQREALLKMSSMRLCVFPSPVADPLARIKSTSFLSRIFIKNFAMNKNFDECIVLGENGYVLETALANLFWIKDHVFYFPSPRLYYFRGVTLQVAILAAKKIGLKIKQGTFLLSDLENANVFICNSIKGIMSVSEVENLDVQENPLLEEALKKNYELISRENSLRLSNRIFPSF